MRMNVFRTMASLVIVLLMTGCADFRTVSEGEPWPDRPSGLTPALEQLYVEAAAAYQGVKGVDGYADIWIKTPEREQRVYSTIQLNRSEDMRIIVSAGIFGWPVADMLFRNDSLFVHDMLNNRLLTGKNTPDNMEKILGLRSDYTFLAESLAGIVSVEHPVRAVTSVRTGYDKVSYSIATDFGSRELLVDPLTRRIEAVRMYDRSGVLRVSASFSGFVSYRTDGQTFHLPRNIELVFTSGRADGNGPHEMVVEYDERSVFSRPVDIRYRVPERAKIIDLDRVGLLPWM
jgi:hypothetical protein